MKSIWLKICFISTILYSQSPDINYHLHLYSINRLSDGGVIKIPFRLADIDFNHQNDNISVTSRLSFEYKPKFSDFYLETSSPEEFSIDLRELYLTWYLDDLEFNIGKQIHTWGSVDQNSPLDNAGPYDYYYIFNTGTDQKMGSLSSSLNYYSDNNTLGFVFSPIHHTNRLPIGDDDFPIELPVVPGPELIKNVDNEIELGAYIKHSFDKGDINLSYYSGNDRVYNLSGVNVFTNEQETIYSNIDTVFTYRRCEVIGVGGTFITDPYIFRFDYGLFHTFDPNSDVRRDRPDKQDGTVLANNWHHILATHAFEEEVYYNQAAFQIEYSNNSNQFVLGLFEYHISEYNANYLAAVDIPGVEADVDPEDYFYPGLGAPIAILTEKALMYQFQKELKDIVFTAKGVNDLNDKGYLIELGLIHSISDDMKIHSYINKVFGDSSKDEDYRFNQMEDFSHFRLELEYYF